MTERLTATITWERGGAFDYKTFDRTHTWAFGGGQSVQGSAAPAYFGDPTKVNPEEGLVAALASCQMLTFLSIAALKGLTVDAYEDQASGEIDKNEAGRMWVSRITLRPKVTFSGKAPDAATLEKLHHNAHERCFIANSLKSQVVLEPR